MRVFITGASGFVGRALLQHLVARGDEAAGLARSDAAAAIVAANGGVPVRGDLHDEAALTEGMGDADLVVHAAAKLAGGPRELRAFEKDNVAGTRTVLRAAAATKVPTLVHVSTEQVVMGDQPLHNADESWPYAERPLGPYAATKQAAEKLVRAASSPDLRAVVVRPRLIWGAGDRTILPALMTAARSGRLRWIGGGNHLTSTCHVDNVVEGILAAAAHGRGGEVYFLTDGEPVRLREFLSAQLATQDVAAPKGTLPYCLARAVAVVAETAWGWLPLPGDPPLDRMTVALLGQECTVDDARARRELGYTAHVDQATGLAGLRRGAAG